MLRTPPISSTSCKISTTSLLMLYLSPFTYRPYIRIFRPSRALTHVQNYWTNELINPFLLNPCDLMRMTLTMNNFVFNDEHLIQQHGTAMGTRMAPAFANLFMGEFERKALEGYVYKPFLWLRYTDDILMVWTHGNEKLESFIAYLNSIHPTIKFTSERSTTSIPFLDVKILLEKGKIQTDLYCKPTNKHQYLLVHSSSHPYHTKKINPLQPCSPFTTYLFKR